MQVTLDYKGKMKMVATNDRGHNLEMDTYEQSGGDDSAQTPKEAVLSGLAGCTAMDIVGILRKMRIDVDSMRIEVEADQTDEHPKVFKNIKMKYIFSKGADPEKVERAVKLSQEQYCGVSAMIKKSADLTYEIIYE
ncbi:MAG TPA: osmotically inducible protein C [Leptospiraceae bacterium]|nr:osmotically inducible protein C [Spirochaetaceae bacterium]HBS03915.1 osmotically inducible protein C [Leptospiraceae bacterium]|tara:strand:- start:164 stop:571 length:408 start_codon:yes stop_codon:yes gene_type:complete